METSPDALEAGGSSAALRAIREIGYGSLAGMVSKVFEHPFDLTKVRLQSQVLDEKARFKGPVDCLVQTWKNEGVRGLYRGLPAPVFGAMVENASLFFAYSEFQRVIRHLTHRDTDHKLPLHQLAIAAAGAGTVTSFFLTPIELVKCKMQVQMLVQRPVGLDGKPQKLPGPISVLMSVVRTTGVKGLWLGQTGTLIRESGGTAAWFSTKEYVSSLLLARRRASSPGSSSPELRPWESAVSGACAGAMFNFVLFPADSVKSTMQTEEELRPKSPLKPGDPIPKRATFGGTFMAMYRAQGLKGLYAGCGVTVARSIPSSAIIFLIYDGLKKHFG